MNFNPILLEIMRPFTKIGESFCSNLRRYETSCNLLIAKKIEKNDSSIFLEDPGRSFNAKKRKIM